MTHRIHLDTDLGGDPDDLCALVMLLGWPDVRVTGITTTQDDDGQRAGYVRHVLRMLGREEIPVASGARRSMTTRKIAAPHTGDTRYWPEPIPTARSGAADAMDLLEASVRGGATVVCIGPVTNVAMFETFRGDMLATRRLVIMGGYIHPPGKGFPQWGPEHDWNVQWDTRAMETVANTDIHLTIVPYPTTMQAPLTERHLREIDKTGPLGGLIARQSRQWEKDAGFGATGRQHPELPDDLVNFHHDPVAVAVALEWEGATIEQMQLMPYVEDGIMWFEPSDKGRSIDVCTGVDAEAFARVFLAAIRAAQDHD